MRAIKNHALSYSDVEVKVREATSNDPWSCPLSLQRELSRATHDYVDYPKLFAMLWKRLADVEHVMHVTKALQLLDFLIRHGSERFVLDVKRRQRDIAALQRYKHYDQSNVDDAKEARAKAKQIHELLSNDGRLQSERQAAEKQRQQNDRQGEGGGGGGGGQYQLTEDEEAEQELYRARKRQLKAQRQSVQQQQDSKEDGLDGREGREGRTAEDDVDEYDRQRRRQPQQTQSRRSNRGRQTEEEAEEMEERDQAEEKRHSAAEARKVKPANTAAANTTTRLKVAASRNGTADRGVSFDPVSEEEMDDDDSNSADGQSRGSQQQRSTRSIKRTVRRKTTSSSVQEAEGDAVTQERAEQEETTQAQRSNVSANQPVEQHTAIDAATLILLHN